MAEWTSAAVQTVNPGESVVFTDNPVRCNYGLILHRGDSGAFLLKGIPGRGCARTPVAVNYLADFGANIAIPEGGTVEEISVAFSLDGNTLTGTEMSVTPSAVEQYFNVSRAANIPIWFGCCQTLSVRNTGSVPILVENANLIISR